MSDSNLRKALLDRLEDIEARVDRVVTGGDSLEVSSLCEESESIGSLQDVLSSDSSGIHFKPDAVVRSFFWGIDYTLRELAYGLVVIRNGKIMARGESGMQEV